MPIMDHALMPTAVFGRGPPEETGVCGQQHHQHIDESQGADDGYIHR